MKKMRSPVANKKGAAPCGRRLFFFNYVARDSAQKNISEKGSILFYIFLAMGLLAALTFSFTRNSRENITTQNAHRMSEELFSQINVIRSAVVECALEYPEGGGDLDGSGIIDATDNPNNPYPVNPSDVNNPHGAAANDQARNLSCTGAPAAAANIFQGANNKGRVLQPIPSGFSEWIYINDAAGVRVQTTAGNDAAGIDALNRLMNRFSTCQADLNYGGCGARCFTAWILRAACP